MNFGQVRLVLFLETVERRRMEEIDAKKTEIIVQKLLDTSNRN